MAGVNMNEDAALTISAYWNGINIISGTVGFLPFRVYRKDVQGREIAPASRIDWLLHERPNEYMSAFTFRQVLQEHALGWGNGYAEIDFDMRGRAIALWPLLPNKMKPEVTKNKAGEKVLVYKYDQGNGKTTVFPSWKIFHVKGMGFDGVKGYSVINYWRESLAQAKALERYGTSFFSNDATPSAVLEHPAKLTDEAEKNLRKSWEEKHRGVDKQHKIAILEEGMKLHQIGVSPEDAQFLTSRKFSVIEVARWLNIPPHMLKDLEKATFSNIESQGIEFVTYTLMPWLKTWESEANYKMFGVEGRRKFFTEFVANALLRGDSKTRFEGYRVAINSGWISRNEVRQLENMREIEGLDSFLKPMNYETVGGEPENNIPLEVEPDDDTAQREKFAELFRDTFRRLVTKEVNTLRRRIKAEDRAEVETLVSEFYDSFRDHVTEVLEPVMRALGATSEAAVKEADRYVVRSRAAILEAIKEENAADVLSDWQNKKAAYLTDEILRRD